MNIINFAKSELNIELSNFEMDLLEILQSDPEGLIYALKPHTSDVVRVLDIYRKWEESVLVAV